MSAWRQPSAARCAVDLQRLEQMQAVVPAGRPGSRPGHKVVGAPRALPNTTRDSTAVRCRRRMILMDHLLASPPTSVLWWSRSADCGRRWPTRQLAPTAWVDRPMAATTQGRRRRRSRLRRAGVAGRSTGRPRHRAGLSGWCGCLAGPPKAGWSGRDPGPLISAAQAYVDGLPLASPGIRIVHHERARLVLVWWPQSRPGLRITLLSRRLGLRGRCGSGLQEHRARRPATCEELTCWTGRPRPPGLSPWSGDRRPCCHAARSWPR